MSVPEAAWTTAADALAKVVDIGTVVGWVWALRRERAEQTAESILHSADMSPDDLARTVRDNEALGDIFAQAVEIGSRKRSERTRRALGAIVGRVLLHPDTARVDETEVLLSTVDQLGTPHVQALVLLHQANEQPLPPVAGGNRDKDLAHRSLTTSAFADRAPGMRHVVKPIMSALGVADIIDPQEYGVAGA